MANVLIVEDDKDSMSALNVFLSARGHRVEYAPNGAEALRAVLDHMPDVVVLDLFMPQMDGPSFLEVVRSYLRLQSLPVIILSGLPDSPMIERARNLKVNSILVKGKATLEEIADAVQAALHHIPT